MFSNERTLQADRDGGGCRFCRGKPPKASCRNCRGLRGGVRRLGRRLTTPLGTTAVAVATFLAGAWAAAEAPVPGSALHEARSALEDRSAEIDRLKGELAVREIQSERLERIQELSSRHDVPAGLASSIHDIALAEGVRPELAFRLVATESSFRRNAVSRAGAVGYTQIKPSTAVWLQPGLTYEDLFETETNLRLGFRYLSYLMEHYEDDRLALLAYNRGPTRVGALLARGHDPGNGYARQILTQLD